MPSPSVEESLAPFLPTQEPSSSLGAWGYADMNEDAGWNEGGPGGASAASESRSRDKQPGTQAFSGILGSSSSKSGT